MTRSEKLADLPHVMIVDDDDRIRHLVSRYLQENGFVVSTAESAKKARQTMKLFEYDALVLDIMMPEETGLDFTNSLRAQGNNIPVLLLTALGESEDRIKGLETGADDYLAKPFEPRELVLRLQSILKRIPQKKHLEETVAFSIGEWKYNPDHKELERDEQKIRLTNVEDNLLCALARYEGEVVSRDDLARLCELDAGERTIDVQVTRLRRKIEDDPKSPRWLQTVRGKGYLLRVSKS